MEKVKELNIKNRAYYFSDDMVNIEDFHSNLLNIEKKSHEYIGIYYIGYITTKKFSDCKYIHSVNPLCLIIHSATGYLKEKYGEKYLIIDLTKKYEEVYSGIKSKMETINSGEEIFYKKKLCRIGVNTDDSLPLNKQLKFTTLTIISRCILQKGEKLYPQIYLNKCLYESKRCFRKI